MSEAIQGLENVLRRVNRLATDVRHVERPMKAAGTYMVGSVTRNFVAGGRPAKWTPLAASTVAQRRRGSGKGGVKPLVDTARLKNSTAMRLRTDGVEVGTNMVQAKRQHFGYPGDTGRGHSKTPARPFMVIQSDDPQAITMIFSRHLSRR
jgi:phage gpG-like protein